MKRTPLVIHLWLSICVLRPSLIYVFLYCHDSMIVTCTGLQENTSLHCHSRASHVHHRRLLEDDLRVQEQVYRDALQTGGGWSGKCIETQSLVYNSRQWDMQIQIVLFDQHTMCMGDFVYPVSHLHS